MFDYLMLKELLLRSRHLDGEEREKCIDTCIAMIDSLLNRIDAASALRNAEASCLSKLRAGELEGMLKRIDSVSKQGITILELSGEDYNYYLATALRGLGFRVLTDPFRICWRPL